MTLLYQFWKEHQALSAQNADLSGKLALRQWAPRLPVSCTSWRRPMSASL